MTAFDPAISRDIEGISVVDDPLTACDDADVLVVLTEWDEFKWVDLAEVHRRMATSRILDTRNILDRTRVKREGFEYTGIGRS